MESTNYKRHILKPGVNPHVHASNTKNNSTKKKKTLLGFPDSFSHPKHVFLLVLGPKAEMGVAAPQLKIHQIPYKIQTTNKPRVEEQK